MAVKRITYCLVNPKGWKQWNFFLFTVLRNGSPKSRSYQGHIPAPFSWNSFLTFLSITLDVPWLGSAWVQPLPCGAFSLLLIYIRVGHCLVSTLTQHFLSVLDYVCKDIVRSLSKVLRGHASWRNTIQLTAGPKVRKFPVSVVTKQSKPSVIC
jgi:hypothetical protein